MLLLVDTGSEVTVVEESVLLSLGVAPSDEQRVGSMHAVEQMLCYYAVVSVVFEDEFANEHQAPRLLDVLAYQPPALKKRRDYQGVLGLDYLDAFRLLYDGPGKRFELSCDVLPFLPPPR